MDNKEYSYGEGEEQNSIERIKINGRYLDIWDHQYIANNYNKIIISQIEKKKLLYIFRPDKIYKEINLEVIKQDSKEKEEY